MTVFSVLITACGGSPSPVASRLPAPPEPPAFSTSAHLARFHSTRFGVSLPLPNGKQWRIDDHSAPVLRARHEPTRSLVELAVWREEELVNRSKCEAHAHERGWAPDAAGEEISAELVSFPSGWDTGVWIGADHDRKAVSGALIVFGAYVHKCLYFRFTTESDVAAADAISDRLAFARLRIFGGLELDSFEIPRARMR